MQLRCRPTLGADPPSRDLFQLRLLLIPVNIGASHWICAEIDFPDRTIRLLDSMMATGDYDQDRDIAGAHLLRYLQDEHRARHGRDLPPGWRTAHPRGLPQQDNQDDCGVFCCFYMDRLITQRPWNFDARHTRYLRARLALALLEYSAPR